MLQVHYFSLVHFVGTIVSSCVSHAVTVSKTSAAYGSTDSEAVKFTVRMQQ